MKTSSKIGLVIVACLFVAAITAGTALAVWGSGNGDRGRGKVEASGGGKMAQAVRGNSSTKPAQSRRGRQGLAAGVLDQVAQELGMTPQDLLSELKGGKTLAQIASEKGADLNTLIDKILEPVKTRLSKMVENGKITQDQADQRLSDLTQKLTDWANNGGPMPGRSDPSGNDSVRDRGPEGPDESPPGADMV